MSIFVPLEVTTAFTTYVRPSLLLPEASLPGDVDLSLPHDIPRGRKATRHIDVLLQADMDFLFTKRMVPSQS
jgi:hypothetical protein